MRILKLRSEMDLNSANYRVNNDVIDSLPGSALFMSEEINLDSYDIVLLSQYSRWKDYGNLLKRVKEHKVKTVLFDNDSCYRSFSDKFYEGINYIFYRCADEDGRTPENGSWLPWSVDTKYFTPSYGGEGIIMPCTVNRQYPLRRRIHRILPRKREVGLNYVASLQNAAGAIHTDSPIVPQVRAKALEYAACGTHIISNRTSQMDFFFPDELITYFDEVAEVKEMIENFEPNVEVQKELRHIVETKHSTEHRVKEIMEILHDV